MISKVPDLFSGQESLGIIMRFVQILLERAHEGSNITWANEKEYKSLLLYCF